ncbi:hypothetical protein [Sphingosinithalassobacter portus]|uniref:hypothetical protein n=1 Tax=Stakelama portus TaxID=2676234 RepID=UPI000D6DFE74|nr:hypothetical protein [Sphingosinithalassobacter portus]
MKPSPLLFGVAGGLIVAALAVPQALHALDRLSRARTEHARLTAQLAEPEVRPLSLVAPPWRAPQNDAGAAARAIAKRLRSAAMANGLLVEQIALRRAPQGLAAVAVQLSGSEKSIIAFVDGISREPPMIRFRSWEIAPGEGGGLRFSGIAVTAWQ